MNSILVFLLLLFSLILLGWLYGYSRNGEDASESFVSFQYDIKEGATIPITTPLPQYSGSSLNQNISKVYDNMFYDVNNGNLIEVDSVPYNGKVSDISGASVSNIWISCRKNAGNPIVTYRTDPQVVSLTTKESQLPFVNSFNNFVYLTKSKSTNPYVVFYMPWNDATYIHMIDLSLNQNVVTELYHGIANVNNSILYTKSDVPVAKTLKPVVDNDANNNKFVTLNNYDKNHSVYQISKNFFFDVQNGQVILSDPTSKSISVYSRNGTVLTGGYTGMTKLTNTSFSTWSAYDAVETKMLLYMAVSQKTMLSIIEPDGNGSYQLFNLQRFTSTGIDTGKSAGASVSGTTLGNAQPSSSSSSSSSLTSPPTADTMMMDYYKWYYYWVNKGVQDPNSHGFNYSDDYMLKTQIVPPICPACSTSVGTCVKCNNAGEVSLVGGVSSGNNKDSSAISGCSGSVPKTAGNVVGGEGRILGSAAKGTVGLGKEIVGGTVGLGREIVGGTVGLGKEIAGETVDLGREIVGGTVDLGKDILGGTVDLGKDIASGIVGLGSKAKKEGAGAARGEDPSRSGYSNSYAGVNSQKSVVDKYSYYGAVPSKGGNYVPMTSDFSKFGR